MPSSSQHGFTLIEALLSVALIALLVGMSLPLYRAFQMRNDLDIAADTLVSSLRRAQTYARGVKGDGQWGVAVQTGSITVFKGASYATRDTSFDETTTTNGTITVTGMTEVVFSKLFAVPATTGSTTLTSGTDTKAVGINAKGVVTY
jgi:prepilin-type N-terminal cleavage/methylation domain-containing protein